MNPLCLIRACVRAIGLLAISLALTSPAFAELPQIENARIVQPPPGAKVAAAYFRINNPSNETLIITGASSDSVKKTEIHLSSVVDDVAKMEKQDSVSVPAGESLEFTHGSFHIMLMGLTDTLGAGQEVTIQLETSAGIVDLTIPVMTMDEAAGMDKMDQGKMKQ